MKVKKVGSLDLTHFFIPLGLLFVLLTFVFSKNSTLLIETVTLFLLLYVISALVHHHFDKSLTFEIIIEYILLAVLSLIVLIGAIY